MELKNSKNRRQNLKKYFSERTEKTSGEPAAKSYMLLKEETEATD